MMVPRGIKHIRHNAVAYLALFFALGGAAYAATLAPANSVNSAAIIDGQVTTPDLAANAVRADETCLLGSCVGSKEVASNAISTGELASGSVSSAKLGGGAVTTAKIASGAVTSDKLASGAVTAAKLATGSVGNGQLGAGAVTGDKVKDGSLSAADIAGGLPPSDAYIGRNDGPTNIGGAGSTGAVVASVNLPAGSYTLTAETTVWNADPDPQAANCALSTGANAEIALPGGGGGRESVTVEDLLTLTSPATAYLRCHTFEGFSYDAKLIAVKVARLHG